MKKNLGTIERAVRTVIGLVLIGLGLASIGTMGVWAYVGIVVGVVLVATAAISFCPVWMALGINTCEIKPGGSK